MHNPPGISGSRPPRPRSGRPRLSLRGLVLAALAVGFGPPEASAQLGLSVGVVVVPEPSVGSRQVGPLISGIVSGTVVGLPLYLESTLARTDFTSLGQDYHVDHVSFVLGAEWLSGSGPTRMGVRLGLGAYGEYEVLETNPRQPGGDNWIETVVPGLVLERRTAGGRRWTVTLSDAVLGPWFAVLDSSEYSIEHRVQASLGIRF